MNQTLLSIFSVVVNEKIFQFIPSSSNCDEVAQALDQLKADFLQLKEDRLKFEAEEAAKHAELCTEAAPCESHTVEAEVVS